MSEDVDGILDAIVQIGTLGAVQLDKDGKLQKGPATRLGDEILGEITGRNAGRKAAMEDKDKIAEEKLTAAADLQAERDRKKVVDTEASKAAGAAQKSSFQRQQQNLSSSAVPNIEQDFLGL